MKLKILVLSILFIEMSFSFADGVASKIIDKNGYQIQINQYNQDGPVVLYVILKNTVPTVDNVKKILKTELLILSKKEGKNNNIIASAWYDDKKVELSESYSALVWVSGKEKTIMTFPDYIKNLKKKKEEAKKKEKLEKQIDK